MNLSLRKITVLIRFKFKELFKNTTFLISIIMVPGITFGLRILYQSMLEGEPMPPLLFGMVLNMGVLYNLNGISLMMPATLLAKEKEKNTLRTLMTSSVNGIEYFISSVIPPFVASAIINVLVLLVSGIDLGSVNLGLYLAVTTIAGLTSCILGMLVGLFAKNQMASSNIVTIVMMVLMMLPLVANMVPSVKQFSDFLYTGIVANVITSFVDGTHAGLPVQSWGILLGEIVIIAGVFVMFYRKNGFEQE